MTKMGKDRGDKDMRGLLQVKYCRVRYRNLSPRQLRKRQDRSKEREKKRQRIPPYRILRNIPLHWLSEEAFYELANMILNAEPIKPKGDSHDC